MRRKKQGREWRVLCPAHPDKSPSLDIREGDAGYPVMTCRSHNCDAKEIIDAVGHTWNDIFGTDTDRWTPGGTAIAFYDYVDENGKMIFQVCRTADKSFRQRQPNKTKASGWEWNLTGVQRVPFRLPRVISAANVGETIYICEGEKDVLALEKTGMVATCNPGGAGKWLSSYNEYFRGSKAIIVADNDSTGKRHAVNVYNALYNIAETVQIVIPKIGKDASDHINAGNTVQDFIKVTPEELQENQTTLERIEINEEQNEERAPFLRFKTGLDFVNQPLAGIEPLVGTEEDGILMPNSLMLLAGIGGAGKTTLSIHMMAHFASGLPWFGITVTRPIKHVIIENEGPHDPYVEKIRRFAERFKNCTCSGEPHGNQFDFLDNCLFLDAPWGHFSFEDEYAAAELRQTIKDFEGDLLIANPLGRLGMRGAGTPEETRAFMLLLQNAGMGEDYAGLLLHHLAKVNKQTPLVQQVSGDWAPHADTIFVLEAAGERRVKLSTGKCRWGDQGRPPMILNWLTDPDGPVGYKLADAPTGVTDSEMYERIDAYMQEQNGPVGITKIAKDVTGQNNKIRELVKKGVEQGRYGTSGGPRPNYWLLNTDLPLQNTGYEDDDY